MIHPNLVVGHRTKFWYPELSNIGRARIGNDCIIHSHVWIGDGAVIGNNVRIQAFSFIPEGVHIEDNVFVGPRVTFTNDKYPPSEPKDWRRTHVKSDSSIGAGAVILPGVTIGRGAKIGAGSVVTRNIPDGSPEYGNPATVK